MKSLYSIFKRNIKCLFCLSICLIIANAVFAQTPYIQWQSSYGGTAKEESNYIQQTKDSGYIALGRTNSTDGEVTGLHGASSGYYDIWVIKLTATGALTWEKCLGGSGTDEARCIQQTSDGGYIVAGYTGSTDGDITNYINAGDVWIVRLNDTGGIVWQNCYGGIGEDGGNYVQQTTDGGFIVAGSTNSPPGGEVTGYHGGIGSDFWVFKLNDTGALLWQKTYGGTNDDAAYTVHQTNDGGYIVGGYTASNNGDITNYHGGMYDYWVLKINDTGGIIWQRTYGGSGDDMGIDMSPTFEGGYIITGYSNSNDSDITSNFGGYDIWTVKINDTGGIIWNKSYGGSSDDYGNSIQQTSDSGYIIGGSSSSSDFEVSDNYGNQDIWIVKTDASGNLQWQKNLGGDSLDVGSRASQTFDGDFVIIGCTRSEDDDVSFNHGSFDLWVAKLGVHSVSIPIINKPDGILVYPVPTDGIVYVKMPEGYNNAQIRLFDVLGRPIDLQSSQETGLNRILHLDNLSPGNYILQIINSGAVSNINIVLK